MKTLRTLLKEVLSKSVMDGKIACIKKTVQPIYDASYKAASDGDESDDRWLDLKPILREIERYEKYGNFLATKIQLDDFMENFLEGIDYSNTYTYKKGELSNLLKNSNGKTDIEVFHAKGTKTLFRGVSLEDYKRIKSQGQIDSDMRGAILNTEGINLGQTPTTARNYLPKGEGVILAVSPKNLDLYMLRDEYIRAFEPIPIENVIKVSEVIVTDDAGAILSNNPESNYNKLLADLKELGIVPKCQ